ncbi:MAG: VCBS repeat-containing protein [Pirellulaceae bacterium]
MTSSFNSIAVFRNTAELLGAMLVAFAIFAGCHRDPSLQVVPGDVAVATQSATPDPQVSGNPNDGEQSTEVPAADTELARNVSAMATDATPTRIGGTSLPSTAPPAEQWATEVFHDLAKAQLHNIDEVLPKTGVARGQQLAKLVADGFACTDLRPSAIGSVWESSGWLVRRQVGEQIPAEHVGIDGLDKALRDWLGEPEGLGQLRVEFKIIDVRVAGQQATTRALVHVRKQDGEQWCQYNAVWDCQWAADGTRRANQPPKLVRITSEAAHYEEIIKQTPGQFLFAECTPFVMGDSAPYRQQGLVGVSEWAACLETQIGVGLASSHGLAIGDVDGDGLEDVYCCDLGGVPNRLYRQLPDGKTQDISPEAGVDFCDFTRSALFADLDNDGDQDLALLMNADLVVCENDGAAHFDVVLQVPIRGSAFCISSVDYDSDGKLDLFVAVREGDAQEHRKVKSPLGLPIPYHDANNGGRNKMFRNEGGFSFRDTTAEIGLDENNTRFGQAAEWEDFDNDGDVDLYVANDFGRNSLYRNDDGHFHDIAADALVEDISAGMSVSWSDFNRDGLMDLYVGNMFSSAGNRIAYQRSFQQGADADTLAQFQRHARGNTLFQNLGDGTFRDVSETHNVTMGRWAWAAPFADLNNDGWSDILVANGFITGEKTDDL